MIDVMCLRQAYERWEIAEVKWIQGDSNPADSITKAKPSNALRQLIDTNTVQLEAMEWVEREVDSRQGFILDLQDDMDHLGSFKLSSKVALV